MRILILTILLLTSTCLAINPLNEVAPNDKQLHFLANYLVTDVSQNGWKWEPWQTLLLVEGLGRFKEYIDVQNGGTWDETDLSANRLAWLSYNVIHFEW